MAEKRPLADFLHQAQASGEKRARLAADVATTLASVAEADRAAVLETLSLDAQEAYLAHAPEEVVSDEPPVVQEPVFAAYMSGSASTKEHPFPVVESASMASVTPPPCTHVPRLSEIHKAALSSVQYEAVARAGACHGQQTQSGARCGFFIGDGTGVGKGREGAAIIADNINRGRAHHVWISVSNTLLHDAHRDLRDVGCNATLVPLHQKEYDALLSDEFDMDATVVFCTYSTLIAQNKYGASRFNQLVDWMGQAFDGVILLDESHRAKNVTTTRTSDCVVNLQRACPQARVVYMSATAGVVAKDLGYMTRLDLWGSGPCRDFAEFCQMFSSVPRLELLCQDLKARGKMVARMLSFAGCDVEERDCTLTNEEEALYNKCTEWWFDAMEAVQAAGHAAREMFALHQAFFKQLITSIKCRVAIASIDDAIAHGHCVVVGLQSTGEARATEAVERGDDGIVSTPHEIALGFITDRLPRSEFDRLREQLVNLNLPATALDQIVGHYGSNRVAELTGRSMRASAPEPRGDLVYASRKTNGATTIDAVNMQEKAAFMDGRKEIAVISDAASCGISLHADERCGTADKRRVHITLETAWSAEKMLQQFGRTHRANQRFAPLYVMVSTNVSGEQRFASAIAHKLESLGAITRGDRRGGHGLAANMITSNLDTHHGNRALVTLIDATRRQMSLSEDLPAANVAALFARMQLPLDNKLKVNKMLNRMLGLPVADQTRLFGLFTQLLQREIQAATDVSVTTIAGRKMKAGDAVNIPGFEETFVVPHSIADGVPWGDVAALVEGNVACTLAQQVISKRLVCAYPVPRRDDVLRILRPTTAAGAAPEYVKKSVFVERYKKMEVTQFKKLWKEARPTPWSGFMICGAVLPIWGSIESALRSGGVLAVNPTRVGNRIGVIMTQPMLTHLCGRIGASSTGVNKTVPLEWDDDDDDDDDDAELSFATEANAAGSSHVPAEHPKGATEEIDDEEMEELLALVGD